MVATQERTIAVTPGANGIGAEIGGVDIASGLSDAQVAEIEQALVRHKVLFFRDQEMTSQQQLAFGRRFGPLEIHPFASFKTFTSPPDEPELIIVEAFPENPMVAEAWHSDVTWRETPAMASILRVTDVPEEGGDTMWADMAAAYADLDDATQRHLSSLTAVHDWHQFRDVLHQTGATAEQIAELVERFPVMEHPVVRTHPVSGEKIVYVNGNFTVKINGMSETKIVLVTGANKGIGFEIARGLAARGCAVLLGARDAGRLRLEGKDYVVADGDVMHFRFNT